MKSEEALKQTEAGIEELANALEAGRSENLLHFLEFQAKFHHYSFRNCLLLAMQNPNATYVAGFARWKQLNRHVRKGEKGLMILAPIVGRKNGDESGQDDKPVVVRGFRAAYVFDVSQTEGADLPDIAGIGGDPGEMLAKLHGVIRSKGIELEFVDDLGDARGVSRGGRIEVLSNLVPAEAFAVAAEYIQLYGGDKELLTQSLDHIQRVSAAIISDLEGLTGQQVEKAA